MNTWEELVRKVLVGNITGNELNPCFLKKIEAFGINLSQSKEPEKTLLKVITIQSKLYSIAQLPLNSIYPNNVACPKENFQYCNNSRKKQLQYILKNKNDQFLTEILEKLSKKNKLVSPDLLPELLDLGSSYPNLQILITKCIGERGVWLSQFSDKWNYVKNQNGTNDNIFFYGSIDERVCYIKKVHKTKPSHAINLIEKVWENEGFMVRSALIKALKLSLTNNDEPFLEKAINDSRHEVRKHAASLLGCLPQSRLVCRMKTLMTQIATYNTTTELLNIELPSLTNAEMKKNGIQPRMIFLKNYGSKSNQLFQIISKIPPEWWSKFFNKTPLQILEYITKTKWGNIFLLGFAHAAKNFHDEEWIIVFHKFYLNNINQKNNFDFSIDFLYENLPNNLFNILAEQYLKLDNKSTFSDHQPIVTFLLTEHQKWNNTVAEKVIYRIQQTIMQDAHIFHWSIKTVLKRAGFAISPLLYERIKENWPIQSYSWNSWKREIDHFLSILKFRWEIANMKD